MLRAQDGWYEDDCGWAIVAITFPHLFTSFGQRCVDRTITVANDMQLDWS